MNNSAAKVGEIFREAGTAFTKLSEMTMMLQPTDDSPPGGKWSDEDVEMLRGCINRFAVELNKISQHIKNRTMIRMTLIGDGQLSTTTGTAVAAHASTFTSTSFAGSTKASTPKRTTTLKSAATPRTVHPTTATIATSA